MNHNCIICTSPTYLDTDQKGRIFHFCPKCRFISLDHSFHLTPSEEKKRYDLHNNSSDNPGYIQWLSRFAEIAVIPYVTTDKRILDFGSGPNPLLKELLELKGYSVDIYDRYFHDYPYSGCYDMIISTEVIEHLKSPLKILESLKESLNEGGYLSLKTAFHPDEDSAFLKWWYKEDSTHISFFSMKTFEYISGKTGLKMHFCDRDSIMLFKN